MKKFIALILTTILTVCILVSFTACGEEQANYDAILGSQTQSQSADTYAWMNGQTHVVPSTIDSSYKNMYLDEKYQDGIGILGTVANETGNSQPTARGEFDYDGKARKVGSASRYWYLSQWASKQTLGVTDNGNAEIKRNLRVEGNKYVYYNDAKELAVDPSTGSVSLRVNGGFEYDYKECPIERINTNRWVHMLLQNEGSKIKFGDVNDVVVYVDFSVDYFKDYKVKTTPGREGQQCAQFVFYLRVFGNGTSGMVGNLRQNRVWVGVPIWDNRDMDDPWVYGERYASDPGTAQALYNFDKSDYMAKQPKVGERFRCTIPVYASLKYMYNEFKKDGVMSADSTFEGSTLAFSNMGWEVLGTMDAQITLHQVGIYCDYK